MKPARVALQMVVTVAGLLAPACGDERPVAPTQLVVAVHADSGLAARLTRLRARIYASDARDQAAPSATLSFELTPSSDASADGDVRLPLSFAIVKKRDSELVIDLEGFEAGQKAAVVEQKLRARFPSQALGLVRVFLSSACAGVSCPGLDGSCDAAAGGRCGDVPSASVARYADARALGDAELVPPDDPAPELACDAAGARDCGGPEGAPRVCSQGVWSAEPPCDVDALCDPERGACRPLAELCAESCTAECAARSACPVDPVDPCADASLCAPGSCLADGTGYTCSCPADEGYQARADALACEDLPECDSPAETVCQGTAGSSSAPFGYQYPCEELAPFYRCTGQLAEYAWRSLATGYRFFPRTYVQGELAASLDPGSPDNVVFDAITGLEWQQKLTYDADITWDAAIAHCSSVRAAGGGFRAPSYVELLGLVDDSGSSRALSTEGGEPVAFDETFFPGPHDAWYWARDTRGTGMATAYMVTQINGVGGIYGEKRAERGVPGDGPFMMRVRCVRPARAAR